MAYEFYVTIEGVKQGKFKGESIRELHKEKLAGLSFNYKVTSPKDASSGMAAGKRRHEHVEFTKEWGASSPQIFQALVTNEVLKSVLFEFIHTTAEGQEEVYHTVKLTNAAIAGLEQFTSADTKNYGEHARDVHELEKVSISFQKIEMESKTGKTMAMDDWKTAV